MLLLLLLLQLSSISLGCIQIGWWAEVAGLDGLQAAEFQKFVKPLVDMAANTYRYPRLRPVPGWELAASVDLKASEPGVRALAYHKDGRMVVAFRGTDLASDADRCADEVLFGKARSMPWLVPSNCSQYTAEQLDYYSQAIDFTSKVLEAHQGPLLLTGHSLGTALAILTSAHFSTSQAADIPAVVFGSPGMRRVIESRGLELGAEKCHGVFSVEDEWDMVSRSDWEAQVGTKCLYRHPEPSDCLQCSSSSRGTCWSCFMETHLMKHVLELVNSGAEFSCGATSVCDREHCGV